MGSFLVVITITLPVPSLGLKPTFTNPSPRSFTSSLRTAFMDYHLDRFFWAIQFLGRLSWVDLIKLVSPSIIPQSFFDFNEIWQLVEVDMWCTTVYSMTRSKVKITFPWKLEILPFSKAYLRHLQWELATDHWFLNKGAISRFDRAILVYLKHLPTLLLTEDGQEAALHRLGNGQSTMIAAICILHLGKAMPSSKRSSFVVEDRGNSYAHVVGVPLMMMMMM